MAARPTLFLSLALLAAAAPLAAQKTPFQSEVDGLIRFFRRSAGAGNALADGTCRQTAMVLTAMGHSHRLCILHDGPVVRDPMTFLFRCRQADGSFADPKDADPAATTRWVMDAMRVLAPDTYEAELATGAAWLAQRGSKGSAFAEFESGPESAATTARAVARGPITTGDQPDMAANVRALLILVKAQHDQRQTDAAPKVAWSETQQRGIDYLLTKQDDGRFYMMIPVGKEGKFMKHHDLGLTGMGIASMLTKPVAKRTARERSVIEAGLTWIASSQDERGGFGRENVNYTTCAAVMALSRFGRPEFKAQLDKAQRFLRALQNTEDRGYARGDRDFGSIGYGGDERGDLSNTHFAVQALRETGLDKGDEAFAKAIVFLQRTQNLDKSFAGKTRDPETGKPVRVISGNDGGSAYYPGNSPAGYIELPDGTRIPRSYGSMTYALLKTYTLCGVDKDDPRVQAAVRWIQKNFDLDTNPGADPRLGEKARYQGLFYYYMVMAQALDTAGIDELQVATGGRDQGGDGKAGDKAGKADTADKADKAGKADKPDKPDAPATRTVDWRKALAAKLASLQSENGSWLNAENGRWWEESALVCTTYAMLALEHCR